MLLCCVYLYIRPETFGTTLVDSMHRGPSCPEIPEISKVS